MGSHKDTLLLPQTTFPIKADLPANEPVRFALWWKEKAYDRMKRDGKEPFILHDGPPYANGDIHIGHALNKILKDFAVKVQYFNGRAVEFVPGWDCHGLPIEHKAKQQHPEAKTPFSLRQMCRDYALSQVNIQREQFKTLGVVADWEHPYTTMDRDFESMIFRRLCDLNEKGLISQRSKPVYWSWAEQTALAEAEIEYKERTDSSVFMVFPTEHETFPGGFLVWTTTPWTLPANVAVALNPDLVYVAVRVKDYKWPVMVAEALYEMLLAKGVVTGPAISKLSSEPFKAKGSDFDLWRLKHPTDATVVPVVMANFVKSDAGTGCVHIAPGHGEEDYYLGVRLGLPTVMPVGPDGKYTEGKYLGHFVFDANKLIIEDLKASGRLVHEEPVTHSYPHCWRSGTAVIFRATPQVFFDLSKVREAALKEFDTAEFLPEGSKNRMRPMLTLRPDWCLSRQRVWGVPVAFVINKDSGEFVAHPDVLKYTREVLAREGIDVWTERDVEYFNPLSWRGAMFVGLENKYFEKCNDILDVWFDSGLTWDTLGGRQADLYLEGNDQHRGWFQSSLWLSVALTGKAPFKKVITHGFVVDPKGEKMAKMKGNVVNPNDVVKKYGAEAIRYWVASTDYTKEISASDEIFKRAAEGHKKLRNTFRFLLANLSDVSTAHSEGRLNGEFLPVDRWILDVAHKVFTEVHDSFEKYEYYKGMHKLTEFVNSDLNSIYFNAVKDRLYCDEKDGFARNSCAVTLTLLLEGLLQLTAPLFTYTADEVLSHAPSWFRLDRKDVFDLAYKPFPAFPRHEFVEYLDETYWRAALDAFHVEFDKLKMAGKVKDTLEVNIEHRVDMELIEESEFKKKYKVLSPPPKQRFFARAEDWFVVSNVGAQTDREALAEFVVEKDVYRIIRSTQGKCERCWKRSAEGTLCLRCRKLLGKVWTQAASEASLQSDSNVVSSPAEERVNERVNG